MGVVAARRVAARMNRSHNPTLNADAISKHAVRTCGGENEPPATPPHATPRPAPRTRADPPPYPLTQRPGRPRERDAHPSHHPTPLADAISKHAVRTCGGENERVLDDVIGWL